MRYHMVSAGMTVRKAPGQQGRVRLTRILMTEA
jgi:hypothetical protein